MLQVPTRKRDPDRARAPSLRAAFPEGPRARQRTTDQLETFSGGGRLSHTTGHKTPRHANLSTKEGSGSDGIDLAYFEDVRLYGTLLLLLPSLSSRVRRRPSRFKFRKWIVLGSRSRTVLFLQLFSLFLGI